MNKCIFLDRDGVLNKDYVDYVYTVERFEILHFAQNDLCHENIRHKEHTVAGDRDVESKRV